MSSVMNEGVMIRYKAITANLLTVVGIIFEPRTYIAKPTGSVEAPCSISQAP